MRSKIVFKLHFSVIRSTIHDANAWFNRKWKLMKHLTIKLFILVSLGSSACISKAEPGSARLSPTNSECPKPNVLDRLFRVKDTTDCSTAARDSGSTAGVDTMYISNEQPDNEFRLVIGNAAPIESTTKPVEYAQSVAEFENMSPANQSSNKLLLDTADGYQTLTPTD